MLLYPGNQLSLFTLIIAPYHGPRPLVKHPQWHLNRCPKAKAQLKYGVTNAISQSQGAQIVTDTMEPRQKAWLHSFLDENHLNYTTSPDLVASPAQVRFMVVMDQDDPYYPCSERLYTEIMARVQSSLLGELYSEVWTRISHMVQEKVEDQEQQKFLTDLLYTKYQHETSNYNIIPSRVEKRLFKLFLVTTQIEDPLIVEKTARNKRAMEILKSPDFLRAINKLAGPHHPGESFKEGSFESLRRHIDALKLRRLFTASVRKELWETGGPIPTYEQWKEIFSSEPSGDGWEHLESFLLTPIKDLAGHWKRRTILYLADRAGEIVFDVALVEMLIRLGHTVILVVKNAALYDLVYLGDILSCPALKEMTKDAEIIATASLSKNDLAAYLKNDRRFKIISDGTMEKLNLARTSVTFSRVFKEVDGVISKGQDQRGRFFESRFELTRDIFSLCSDENNNLSVMYKAMCPRAVHFSSQDLEDRAGVIIDHMREAKEQGDTVMFYSGIVGSIPGEIETAIQVMTTYVEYLTKQQAQTFIINPSKYFEEGMDADDLMYMWEQVQRSGYIDIWRFQTVSDIEKSFELMGRKVPPQWVGKDSTYSTGCTKEMGIALDVQKHNREMQIIGPDPEKFFRRSEYGIGLFHDTKLNEIYER
jgi:uncharacterized protein with ATP-grasp and redox domains